jgi:CBS domain-containing protein
VRTTGAPRSELIDVADLDSAPIIAADLMTRAPVSVRPWESCRIAAERMAQAAVGRLPVVDGDAAKLVGIVTLTDLLGAPPSR